MEEAMPGYRNKTDTEIFPVFVQLYLDEKVHNYHFTPSYKMVKLCQYPYDMILQVQGHLTSLECDHKSKRVGSQMVFHNRLIL